MKNSGITLIELIIVISIVGILAIALGFSFQGWLGSYKVESQIKEMYVDLMNTRARAMQRNRIHFINFPSTSSYAIYEDDSNGTAKVPDGDGTLQTGTGVTADTRLGGFPKTVQYALTWAGNITFDTRGLVSPNGTIRIDSTVNPDYDCIVLFSTRINMGKWEECDNTNPGNECCPR